jgi:hypothetical protein
VGVVAGSLGAGAWNVGFLGSGELGEKGFTWIRSGVSWPGLDWAKMAGNASISAGEISSGFARTAGAIVPRGFGRVFSLEEETGLAAMIALERAFFIFVDGRTVTVGGEMTSLVELSTVCPLAEFDKPSEADAAKKATSRGDKRVVFKLFSTTTHHILLKAGQIGQSKREVNLRETVKFYRISGYQYLG